MNERIKQLAEQAKAQYCDLGDASCFKRLGLVEAVVFKPEDLEKFAELIVRECINKIETYRIPVGNSAAGEMACEWTYDALKEIRDDIKEHFGI